MKAVIAGGGIGGLAAAIGLRRVGVDVLVLERAPRIEEVGAGLSLWANAMSALQWLGIDEQVALAGSALIRAVTYSSKGAHLDTTDLSEIHRRAGIGSICAHRAELQRVLAEQLPQASIRTGTKCIRFEQDGNGVTLFTRDGSSESADILIGADGIRSAIRAQLLGDTPPRYAGYVALRGILQRGGLLPQGDNLFVQGPGMQVGVMPCGANRTYWFATRNAKAGARWTKQQIVELLHEWPQTVKEAIEGTDESAILQGDVIDRPPSAKWGEGRVTLLGDAIHPTTPNLGQGACQALEDAVSLARCVGNASTVEAALREYERRRKPRTRMVTEQSWRIGSVLQWENSIATWLRDAIARTSMARRSVAGLFEKLLIHRESD